MIKEVKEGLLVNIRVSPNASKNEIIISDDMIKLKITSQPVEGKANKAVIEFLSKFRRFFKSLILPYFIDNKLYVFKIKTA